MYGHTLILCLEKYRSAKRWRNSGRRKIGVTPDCVLYHSFRIQHMDPKSYTSRAYIGETSIRQRIRQLEERCQKLQEERLPIQVVLEDIKKTKQLEMLHQPTEDYMNLLSDIKEIPIKERRKRHITEKMLQLKKKFLWMNGKNRRKKSGRSRKSERRR